MLVSHDMLGLVTGAVPPFVRQYAADLAGTVDAATRAYIDDVHAGRFPGMKAAAGAHR